MSIRNELLEQILSATQSGIAASKNYYYEVGRFSELAAQPGGLADERLVVTFGSGGTDSLGIVTMDSGGIFTVNKTGPVSIKQRIRVTRPSNVGSAEVYFQAQVSVDGGLNWVASGSTQHESIDEGGDTDVFLDVSMIEAFAGVKLRATWAQSSTGQSDASLEPAAPSAAMQADGFEVVPSSETVVYALKNFDYV